MDQRIKDFLQEFVDNGRSVEAGAALLGSERGITIEKNKIDLFQDYVDNGRTIEDASAALQNHLQKQSQVSQDTSVSTSRYPAEDSTSKIYVPPATNVDSSSNASQFSQSEYTSEQDTQMYEQPGYKSKSLDDLYGSRTEFESSPGVLPRTNISNYVDVEDIKNNQDREFLKESLRNGYTEQQARSHLLNKLSGTAMVNLAERRVADIENANSYILNSALKHISTIFGGEEHDLKVADELGELNTNLRKETVDGLRRLGFDAYHDNYTGPLKIRTEDGLDLKVTTDLLDHIFAAKYEVIGAVAGGAAILAGAAPLAAAGTGISLGAVGTGLLTRIIQLGASKGVAKYMVTGLGSAVGASFGSAADYIKNSVKTEGNIDAWQGLVRMRDAGIMDWAFTSVGGVAFKYGISPVSGAVWKAIGNAYQVIANGNVKGAYELLLSQGITPEQAKEFVRAYMKLSPDHTKINLNKGTIVKGSASERLMTSSEVKMFNAMTPEEISDYAKVPYAPSGGLFPREKRLTWNEFAIGVLTQFRNTESIIGKADNLIDEVNKRALDVNKIAELLTTGETARDSIRVLNQYGKMISDDYGKTKDNAINLINRTGYRFDIPNLLTKDFIENSRPDIDPGDFLRLKSLLESAEKGSTSRTFEDLLELREFINRLKGTITASNERRSLTEMIGKIDTEMDSAVRKYMTLPGQADTWLNSYKKANIDYSNWKSLQKNVIVKHLESPVVTEENTIAEMLRVVPTFKEEWNNFKSIIPQELRDRISGAFINHFVKKATKSTAERFNAAIDFADLAENLRKVDLTGKANQEFKSYILEAADLVASDPRARIMGKSQIHANRNSYLTYHVVERIRYTLASWGFNYAKLFFPGDTAKRAALGRISVRIAANPLDIKSAKEFISEFPEHVRIDMENTVKDSASEWTEKGYDRLSGELMFVDVGDSMKVELGITSGSAGDGFYMHNVLPGDGSKRIHNVAEIDTKNMKLANLKDIEELIDYKVTWDQVRKTPEIRRRVEEHFDGFKLDDGAMLFQHPSDTGISMTPGIRQEQEAIRIERISQEADRTGTIKAEKTMSKFMAEARSSFSKDYREGTVSDTINFYSLNDDELAYWRKNLDLKSLEANKHILSIVEKLSNYESLLNSGRITKSEYDEVIQEARDISDYRARLGNEMSKLTRVMRTINNKKLKDEQRRNQIANKSAADKNNSGIEAS